MLTYKLKDKNKYYSLYSAIRDDILKGNLRSGEKLPSKRSLAQNLSVSVITVQTAYEQLLAEGYIVSKERSGYFVTDSNVGYLGETSKSSVETTPQESYAVDLVSGSTPAELFPFSVWAKLMRMTLLDEGEHLLQRVPCDGDWQLKEEIAACLYRMRGVRVDPKYIVVGAGAEYLYGVIVQLLGRDKCYAVENPGFTKISFTYDISGAKCAYIPVGKCGVESDDVIASNADVLHISPSHQFPTGAVMPAATRVKLIKWAVENDKYIVEDDYDSEFRLYGKPLQCMLDMNKDRVIYINTFSKSLAPSMRIGYMVLPPKIYERFIELFGKSANVVPLFEQKTLAAMLGGGYFERHINRLKNYYRDVHEGVLKVIAAHIHDCKVIDTKSGLHLTIYIPSAKSDEQIKQEAKRLGVKLNCLTDYLLTPQSGYEKTAVINYSGVTKEKLSQIQKMKL